MVNADQLIVFGPGSEWFWSMLQLVVVAVSLLGLYRQVRLQSGASAIEQAEALAATWNSERVHRSRLAVLLFVRDTKDWANVPRQASNVVGDLYERVGYLVRKGHIGGDLVNAYLGSAVRLWWVLLRPYAMQLRQSLGDPAVYEHFEWLAEAMGDIDRKAGVEVTFDDAGLAERIRYGIQVSRDAIHAEQELRAVPVISQQPPDGSPVAEPQRSGDIREH